jgi:hypothetical protein
METMSTQGQSDLSTGNLTTSERLQVRQASVASGLQKNRRTQRNLAL